MKLVISRVDFNELDHTYLLDGKQLSGITSVLSRQLFKDKYKGISEEVLDLAKQRGHDVHHTIELGDSFEGSSDPIYNIYRELLAESDLERMENEYLVSDNENYASCIDVVMKDLSLADIKTTSRLDMDYISWQLSIYAYLFERQNPTLKANKLYAIWIPNPRYGKPAIKEVTRISSEKVKELLDCDARGEQYVIDKAPAFMMPPNVIEEIINIETQLKEFKEKSEMLKKGLLELMKDNNVETFKCETLQMIRKKSSVRTSFDSVGFKKDNPELYEKYVKSTNVAESLTFKIL